MRDANARGVNARKAVTGASSGNGRTATGMPDAKSARRNGHARDERLAEDDYAGLLIDRLATAIVDSSLPLKDVERDLRGSVAEVAVKKRGLGKRETANRCGVTEKSIENYLKEARCNPKSPEREIVRILQDEMLSLEEIYDAVRGVLSQTKNFTLDDAKQSLDKLIRTGEVREYPGHKYRAVDRPSIRYPRTIEAHRELVDQKAKDLDYIILRQKEAQEEDIERRQRFSRVVVDSNLVRIDFTVDVDEDRLADFYETLSEEIAKLTLKHEKKKGRSRLRLILGMRAVLAFFVTALLMFVPLAPSPAQENATKSWELDEVIMMIEDGSEEIDGDGEDLPDLGNAESLGMLPSTFYRGDVNFDFAFNLTDVVVVLLHLKGVAGYSVQDLPCLDAADADDSGRIDLTDPIKMLQDLFGPDATPTLGLRAEFDPTLDDLGCRATDAV